MPNSSLSSFECSMKVVSVDFGDAIPTVELRDHAGQVIRLRVSVSKAEECVEAMRHRRLVKVLIQI